MRTRAGSVAAFANAVGVTLAIGACRAPASDASPAGSASAAVTAAPRSGPYLQGELATAADYTLTVEAVRECPDTGAVPPKRGYVRLGLELSMVGTSERQVPANPFYATLRDANGESYPGTLGGCEPALPSTLLTKGQRARGHVSFDVPKTAVTLELRYAPRFLGEDADALRFSLRR